MAQIKIYGMKSHLDAQKQAISDAIHASVVEVLGLPTDKRFHRFIGLDKSDFIYPDGRSEKYIILEISMFEGRSATVKKQLIRQLFTSLEAQADIAPNDVEITIFETPRANWGIRGLPADELDLNYKIDV